MSEAELKRYFAVYTECWKMFRSYSEPKDNDEFWQALVDEAEEIVNRNGKTEFAKAIAIATINEIERIHRKK